MGLDFATVAVVFGTIFLVELPDKTFIATLVMSTRWRPLLVWIGVVLAFFVQTAVAVLAGGLISRLPRTLVEVAACVMFLIGGILLLRGAGQADEEEAETEAEFGAKAAAAGRRLAGRHPQLHGALPRRVGRPVADPHRVARRALRRPGVGVRRGVRWRSPSCRGLAAALGRTLLTRMRLSTLRRIGGGVCLVLAAYTALEIAGVL